MVIHAHFTEKQLFETSARFLTTLHRKLRFETRIEIIAFTAYEFEK